MKQPFPGTAIATAAAAEGARADGAGRLEPGTLARLAASGLLRSFVPRGYGGSGGSFADLFARTAVEAETCASAAWCAVLWAWHGRCAAMLPSPARREIWGGSADARISAALSVPAGRAEPVGAGWLVSGSWRRVSGAAYADWILLTVADGLARPLVFAVPAQAVTIVPTWDAAGLRATRTDTVRAHEVFVPEYRAVPLAHFLDGLGSLPDDAGEPAPRGISTPAKLGGPVLLCAPALGSARAAIRGWASCVQSGSATVRRSEREAVVWCTDRVDTAGRLLAQAARRADEAPANAAVVARNERDTVLAAQTLRQVTEHAMLHATSAAPSTRALLDRSHRDVHTATSHSALRPAVGAGSKAPTAPRTPRPTDGALR